MSGHDHHHHDGEGQDPPSDMTLRVKALESLLVEKGIVDPAALDAIIDTYEYKIGPRNGARVVARAWRDPAYKARLLEDATAAIAELGYGGRQGEHMIAVENTPKVHNLVVCTRCVPAIPGLCSDCRPSGTSPLPIARAPSSIRKAYSPNSVLLCRTTLKSASGIRPPRSAISFCPSGRPGRKRSTRMPWLNLSRATA